MKINKLSTAALALLPSAAFSKEVLFFDGEKLGKKTVATTGGKALPTLDKHLRSMVPDNADDNALMEVNIPLASLSTLEKLAATMCSLEETADAMYKVSLLSDYYCDEEAAGFVAGAATTAIAENLHVAAGKTQLAVEGQEHEEAGVKGVSLIITCLILCWSRSDLKRDIRYLNTAARDEIGKTLLDIPIATWNYKVDGKDVPQRLGFIIEDIEPSFAVQNHIGDAVNLYGFISMAAAAIQMQQDQIKELQEDVRKATAMKE